MAAQNEIDVFNLDLFGNSKTIVESAPDEQAIRPTRGAFWDHSGTIVAANVSQLLMKENPARCYLLIQNLSNVTLWLGFTRGAIAGQPSIRVDPGGELKLEASFVSTEAIYALADTAGAAFVAKEASK